MGKKRESANDDELLESVDQLRQEVRMLRQSIDEFREDLTHLLRNLPGNLPPPYQHLSTHSFETATESRAESPPIVSVFSPPVPEPPTVTAATVVKQIPQKPQRQTLFDDEEEGPR